MALVPYRRQIARFGAAYFAAYTSYELRQIAHTAAGDVARAALREVRRRAQFRSGRTVSRLQNRVGPIPEDSAMMPPAKRRNFGPVDSVAEEGGYAQETRVRLKTGRKVPKSHIDRVLGHSDILSRTLFFKRLPAVYTGNPDYSAANTWQRTLGLSHNTAGATGLLPVYLFNLDRLQLAGLGVAGAHRLNYDKTTGLFTWSTITHSAADGTSATTPQVLRQSTDFSVNPQKELYIGNYVIKLNLYGCTVRPLSVDIMLVSFSNEEIAPTNDVNSLNGGGATGDGLEHQTFWQEQVQGIVNHPCAVGLKYGQSSKMKIHKKATYNIGPITTTQSDTAPHSVIVNWFHQRNKRVNMRNAGDYTAADAPGNILDPTKNDTDTAGTAGLNQETPLVKDRMYLYVRGNDYVVNTIQDTAGTCGGFDISYTMTYYINV